MRGKFFQEVKAGTVEQLPNPLVDLIVSYADRYNIRGYDEKKAKADADLLKKIQEKQQSGNDIFPEYTAWAKEAAAIGYIESLVYLLQNHLVDVTQTPLLPSAAGGSQPGIVAFLLEEHRECLKTLTSLSSKDRHSIVTVMLKNDSRLRGYDGEYLNYPSMAGEIKAHHECLELLYQYAPLVINIAWQPEPPANRSDPTFIMRPTPLHLAVKLGHQWTQEILFLGACTDQNNVQEVTKWMFKTYAANPNFLMLLQAQAVHDKDNQLAKRFLEDKEFASSREESTFKQILKYYKELKEETGLISKTEPVWNTHTRVFNEAKSASLVDKVVAVLEQKSNKGVYKNLSKELLAKKAEFDREEKPAKKLLEFLSPDKDKKKADKPFDEVLFIVRSLLWDSHAKQMKGYIEQQSKTLAAELAALPKPGEASVQQPTAPSISPG